mgnify:FL=1
MEPDVYNEMLSVVNFTEKDVVCKQIYETLALEKESWILDAGCGPGVIAEMLHSKGYENIYGADASEKFIEFCKSKPWYKDCDAFYFG